MMLLKNSIFGLENFNFSLGIVSHFFLIFIYPFLMQFYIISFYVILPCIFTCN